MHRIAALLLLLLLFPWIAPPAFADDADDIRARLEQWTDDFNNRRIEAACDLFSRELISDFRGQGEANYETRCGLITAALSDRSKTYRYALDIREIIVEGDIAIVRLVWTFFIAPLNITTVEPGMDIFRREADGQWRIIRYMAYEEER